MAKFRIYLNGQKESLSIRITSKKIFKLRKLIFRA